MSVLSNPQVQGPQDADKVALDLLRSTKQTFKIMVDSFNTGSKKFWQDENGITPQAIADALGTSAAEVFQLHAMLGGLIAQVKPEAISDGLSYIGNVTYNQDGTIQIN